MAVVETDVVAGLDETLNELQEVGERIVRSEQRLADDQMRRRLLVELAADQGATQAVIAKLANLSNERVRQILLGDEFVQRKALAREAKKKP